MYCRMLLFMCLISVFQRDTHTHSAGTGQTWAPLGLAPSVLSQAHQGPVPGSTDVSFCLWLPCILEKTALHSQKANMLSHSHLLLFYLCQGSHLEEGASRDPLAPRNR